MLRLSCTTYLTCGLVCANAAAQYPYRIVDVGALPGQTGAVGRGISSDGRKIVGWSGSRPFLWEEGVGMRDLGALTGHSTAAARGIDAAGRVVGQSGLEVTGAQMARAVRWELNGTITNLGTLTGGRFSMAWATNAQGHVVGDTEVLPTTTLWHGFRWDGIGGMVDLTPGSTDRFARGINALGQVAGYGGGSAWRFTPGTGLQVLGAPAGFTFANSFQINDAGQLCGSVGSASGNVERVARFTGGIGWEVLGGTGSRNQGWGINSFGQVVGLGRPSAGLERGLMFTDGLGLQDLNQLTDPAQNWLLQQAYAINDRGQISGHGFNNTVSQTRAVRLDPQYMQVYGSGCGNAAGRMPKLLVAGLPAPLQTISILMAEGAPSSAGALVLSGSQASLPFGSCTALVTLPGFATAPFVTSAVGQARVTLTLPASLAPGLVYLQFAVFDPTAPDMFTLSNGVTLQLL